MTFKFILLLKHLCTFYKFAISHFWRICVDQLNYGFHKRQMQQYLFIIRLDEVLNDGESFIFGFCR